MGLLLSFALATSQGDFQTCVVSNLTEHGVSLRDANRALPYLTRANDRDRSVESVEILARRTAGRVSNDSEWIDWAAWVAGNAYSQCKN